MRWKYDQTQTGMPVYDTETGERICDMDCVDFYEICDDDEDKLTEYEQRRDRNGVMIASLPVVMRAAKSLMDAVKRHDHGGFYMGEVMALDRALFEATKKGE